MSCLVLTVCLTKSYRNLFFQTRDRRRELLCFVGFFNNYLLLASTYCRGNPKITYVSVRGLHVPYCCAHAPSWWNEWSHKIRHGSPAQSWRPVLPKLQLRGNKHLSRSGYLYCQKERLSPIQNDRDVLSSPF